jgi:hypothetical protein
VFLNGALNRLYAVPRSDREGQVLRLVFQQVDAPAGLDDIAEVDVAACGGVILTLGAKDRLLDRLACEPRHDCHEQQHESAGDADLADQFVTPVHGITDLRGS